MPAVINIDGQSERGEQRWRFEQIRALIVISAFDRAAPAFRRSAVVRRIGSERFEHRAEGENRIDSLLSKSIPDYTVEF